MTAALLRGFLLSLALILPLGPQNIFVLGQGAIQPRLRLALPVILTAALSDTLLIALAVGGVSLVLVDHPWLREGLQALGALFLLYIAVSTWRAPAPGDPAEAAARWPLWRKVRHSLSVSLLNPHAILDTLFVIGGGAAIYAGRPERLAYAVGAIAASWIWFFVLGFAGGILRRAGGYARVGRFLGRISAILLAGLAVVFVWQALGGH